MMKRSLFLLAFLGAARLAFAQGTAFTYQGRLDTTNGPANGLYDFRCQLYSAREFGALVSTTVTNAAVPVTNGLFVINLDFGLDALNGAERWLSIDVRTNNALNNFSHLSPRQRLAPTPYAVYATKAGGLQDGATITGTLSFNAPSGPPFNVGSSIKVPNLNADLIDGLDSTAFVLKTGDAMSGNLTIADPATLSFGSNVRQMINLWGNVYGIGVQAASLYFRTDDGFAWFRDGVHAVGTYDPGAGGTTLMTLSPGGNLAVTANNGGNAVSGDAGAFLGGVGVQGLTAGGLSAGVQGWAQGALNWGVFGRADGSNSIGVYGVANFPSGVNYGMYGESHSLQGYGVYGRNDAGIAVYGLQGPGSGGISGNTGVYGESTASGGNGVVGVANTGSVAFGVWGRSTDGDGGHFSGGRYGVYGSSGGFAGRFDGAVRIDGNSSHGKPFLQLHETEDGDYARISLQVADRPLWHVSVGGGDNSLVFYNDANSIVTSISEAGLLTTRVLTITGGADIAEPFRMSEANLPKGAVVVIDEENPGQLKLSTDAYDKRVAGIISGAGGVHPGLSLSQQGVVEGDQHVALSGRVYVQAETSTGAIKPGDLLTSSETAGHAMKVTDHTRAQGAILGKAMTGLKEGKGLVLVLVTLQ